MSSRSSVIKRKPAPKSKLAGAKRGLKLMRIFISHKTKDRAAVMALKRMVEERCRKIKVFASCDAENLRGGTHWLSTIHRELEQADILMLLYTRPDDNWEWCIYEAGYYLGHRSGQKAETLVVIHPPGVMIPAPFKDRQSIKAEPVEIEAFLKGKFRPGDPNCHWNGTLGDLTKMADEIAKAVRRWAAGRAS